MTQKGLAIAIACLCALCLASLAADSSAWADYYVERGIAFLAAGYPDEARRSAEMACAYGPVSSDALYLYALSLGVPGRDERIAVAAATLALERDSFSRLSRRACERFAGNLLAKRGDWKAALLLSGYHDGRALADPGDALLALASLYRSGDAASWSAFAAECIAFFVDDPRFARHFLQRALSYGDDPAIARALDLARARAYRLGYLDPELFALAARFEKSEELAFSFVRAYRALCPGPSRTGALLALEYGLLGELDAIEEFFSAKDDLDLEALGRFIGLVGTKEGSDRLAAALAAFSGVAYWDKDRDGEKEGIVTYVKGHPLRCEFDDEHDGVPRLSIAFSGLDIVGAESWSPWSDDGFDASYAAPATSIPSFLSEAKAGIEISFVSIRYERYPEARAISRSRPDGSRVEYRFPADGPALACCGIERISDRFGFYAPFAIPAPIPTARFLWSAASEVELLGKTGKTEVLVTLRKGVPILRKESRGVNGMARTLYSGGFPVLEYVDSDGDGREEERVTWGRDGLQVFRAKSEIDADGDGTFEYMETYGASSARFWDYDGNGLFDARASFNAEGGMEYAFSSAMDGRFDSVAFVSASGGPASVSRNGMVIPLVADSWPGVFWLGAKPFDLGARPSAEGVLMVTAPGGSRIAVRAVRFGEYWYLEAYR